MRPRIEYCKELEKLNQDVLGMSNELETAIDKTATAVQTRDVKLADELIKGDDVFDHMERSIEKYCIDLVIKEAPIASDWRKIASIMRIVGDLERIADHCSDISTYVLKLAKEPIVVPPENIQKMIGVMKSMVHDMISSFVNLDTQLASEVVERDEVVDDLFEKALDELSQYMSRKPEEIGQYVNYILIIKYIERMSDHSVNVAKWIPYISSGDYRL